ncbi:hypothetical protein [Sphingomonas sp. BAUL-RG-20F-R05-02]|uniref:hypothetical protein n=1 Tax=Sphingomonas sp. BAUL-RG-20F-R05-02 TaxID=2914830 RepID=UPI001F599E1E|nr:hypothetical protein [Sphingomonas sp. BAUL-RG-20F-R05-02]
MSRQPRSIVAQRKRLFVGCEGESEQGYAVLLGRIADSLRIPVHLDAVLLQPGGGDPLALVQLAIQRAGERSERHGDYERSFILLDDDKLNISPDRDGQIAPLAAQAGLVLIWQHTCHEALLLRHLEGCAQRRPGSTPLALTALIQEWPAYRKGLAAMRLAKKIDHHALSRAALVENKLAELLVAAGLI